jgi:uncharacterized protein with FMN-binding domain
MSECSETDIKRSNGRVTNGVVSASCAAVLAVYIAGYTRTQSAASRFTAQIAERRVAPRSYPTAPLTTMFHTVAPSTAPAVPPRPARDVMPGTVRVSHPDLEPALPTAKVSDSAVSVSPADTPAQPAPVTVALEAPPVIAQLSDPAPPAAEQTPEAAPASPRAPWKDGTYTGWGYSRHGNIEAQVVIEGGRIASATISQCRTRYSCSVIDRLPPQVAQRQSPDVDYVSGATQSADAFYAAVVAALEKAK